VSPNDHWSRLGLSLIVRLISDGKWSGKNSISYKRCSVVAIARYSIQAELLKVVVEPGFSGSAKES